MAYKRSSPDSIRIVATIYRESPETIPTPGVYLILDRSGTILYIGETKNINRRMNQFVTNYKDRIWTNGAKDVQYERIESGQERRDRKNFLIGAHNPKCNTRESLASEFGNQQPTIGHDSELPTFSEFYDQRNLDALERAGALIDKASELAFLLAPQLQDPIQALRGAINGVIQAERRSKLALHEEYVEKLTAETARRIASGESPLRWRSHREEPGEDLECPYCGNPY